MVERTRDILHIARKIVNSRNLCTQHLKLRSGKKLNVFGGLSLISELLED